MIWEPVALGVVSGLVGVFLGAFFTLKNDQQKQSRLDRGAARVTYFELGHNSGLLEAASEGEIITDLVIATWPATRAQIALCVRRAIRDRSKTLKRFERLLNG